jgi:hypothetical protein
MGTATVEMLTAEQAREERDRILAELGMSMESLEQDAANGLLDAQEFRVWRRIQTLNWLLEEDA